MRLSPSSKGVESLLWVESGVGKVIVDALHLAVLANDVSDSACTPQFISQLLA